VRLLIDPLVFQTSNRVILVRVLLYWYRSLLPVSEQLLAPTIVYSESSF
jgi:hypothetical protein